MPKRKHDITITTSHSASSYGCPVCLVDDKLVDDATGLKAGLAQLRYSQREFAELCGKSTVMVQKYCQGKTPVPAEVWLVLREELTGEGV